MWPAPPQAVWAAAPWKHSPILWGSVQSPMTVLQPEHRGRPGPHRYRAPGAPELVGSWEQDLHQPWERYRWAPGRPCHRPPGST